MEGDRPLGKPRAQAFLKPLPRAAPAPEEQGCADEAGQAIPGAVPERDIDPRTSAAYQDVVVPGIEERGGRVARDAQPQQQPHHLLQHSQQQQEQGRRLSQSTEMFRASLAHHAEAQSTYAPEDEVPWGDGSGVAPVAYAWSHTTSASQPPQRTLGPGTAPPTPVFASRPQTPRNLKQPPGASMDNKQAAGKMPPQLSGNPSHGLNNTIGSDAPSIQDNYKSMRQSVPSDNKQSIMQEELNKWTQARHKSVRIHFNKDANKNFAAMRPVERAQMLRQHGTAYQLTHPAYTRIIDFAKYFYIPKDEVEVKAEAVAEADHPGMPEAGRGGHDGGHDSGGEEMEARSEVSEVCADVSEEHPKARRGSLTGQQGRDTQASPTREVDERLRWKLDDCPTNCERHATLLPETLDWLECVSTYSIMGDLPLHGCFFLMLCEDTRHLGLQQENAKKALKVLAKEMILRGKKLYDNTDEYNSDTNTMLLRKPPVHRAWLSREDSGTLQRTPSTEVPPPENAEDRVRQFDVNVPYCSDLGIWRNLMCEADALKLFDQGMYTGETVLHFAIAMNDEEMVEFLLHNGAKVDATARGVFFMPRSKRKAQAIFEEKKRKMEKEELRKMQGILQKRSSGGTRASFTKELARRWLEGAVLQGTGSAGNVPPLEHSEEEIGVDEDIGKEKNILVRAVGRAVSYLWGQDDGDLEAIVDDGNEWSAFPYHKDQYLGQTPLSLAVALGFKKICVKIKEKLISKSMGQKKNSKMSHAEKQEWRNKEIHELIYWRQIINAKDDMGNTALHLAVLHGQKGTFDWLMSNGAERGLKVVGSDKGSETETIEDEVPGSFNELNNQGLTPLTYAVWLGDLEMYSHIVQKFVNRSVWKYGSSELRRLDLMQLDTFRIKNLSLHQNPAWRSVFEIIVLKENAAFAQEPVFKALVRDKWNKYAWGMYVVFIICPYVVVFTLFAWATKLRMHEISLQEPSCGDWGGQSVPFQLTSSVLGFFVMIRIAYVRMRVKWRDLDSDGNQDVSREEIKMFIFKNLSSLFCLLLVPLFVCIPIARSFCATQTELNLIAAVYVVLGSNLLNLITPFKFFSVLILTIFRMLIADVLRFLVVYCIVLLAFSGAVHVLARSGPPLPENELRDENLLDDNLWKASLQLLYVSLGEVNVGNVVQYSGNEDLMQGVLIVWIIITNVLLLNLLISMMAETFQRDQQDHHKDPSVFPVAQYVLECEKTLSEQKLSKYRSGTREGFKPDPEWDQEDRRIQTQGQRASAIASAAAVTAENVESKDDIAMSEHRYLRLDILEGMHDERIFPPINSRKTTSVLPTSQVGSASRGKNNFWGKVRSLLRAQ